MTLSLALVVVGVALVTRPSGPTVIGGHPLLDRPAPDFALVDLAGQTVRLADYRGRPVIVYFWASWCIPCRAEFPLLKAARERYADAGLEVLGVVFDDEPDAAREYMARAGADWPALVDPGDVMAMAYTVFVPPLSFFVDGDGIVRSIAYGPPPSGSIDERIASILPPSPATSP